MVVPGTLQLKLLIIIKDMERKSAIRIWFLIILLAVIFRVWSFGSIPGGLNRDEAALGYNAYALSQEGRDEWGVRWPTVFRSFGDYKLPGYVYLLIPLVKFFGPSETIIRFPSLLAGIAVLLLVAALVREIWPKDSWSGFLSAIVIATSPWAIYYSRVAFEAHVALVFLLGFIWLLLKGLNKPFFLLIAPILLFISILTYNTPLILAPVILSWFLVCLYPRLKKIKIKALSLIIESIIAIALSFVVLLPVIRAKQGITIFTDPTLNSQQREERVSKEQTSPVIAKFTKNRYVFFSLIMAKNYIYSFSPTFLVLRGGSHPWHTLPGLGHFSKTAYILMMLGIIIAPSWLKNAKTRFVFGIWLLALLPAIITVDAPHATRSLLFFALSPVVITAAIKWLASKYQRGIAISIFLLCVEGFQYFFQYQSTPANTYDQSWKFGLKEAIFSIEKNKEKHPIYFTDYTASPYIYVLLYARLLPGQFLSTITYYPTDNAGLTHVKSLNQYFFVSEKSQVIPPATLIYQDETGKFLQEIIQ